MFYDRDLELYLLVKDDVVRNICPTEYLKFSVLVDTIARSTGVSVEEMCEFLDHRTDPAFEVIPEWIRTRISKMKPSMKYFGPLTLGAPD